MPIHTAETLEERLPLGDVFSISAMFAGTFMAGPLTVLSADQLPVFSTADLKLLEGVGTEQPTSTGDRSDEENGHLLTSVLPDLSESQARPVNEGGGTSAVANPRSAAEFEDDTNSGLSSDLLSLLGDPSQISSEPSMSSGGAGSLGSGTSSVLPGGGSAGGSFGGIAGGGGSGSGGSVGSLAFPAPTNSEGDSGDSDRLSGSGITNTTPSAAATQHPVATTVTTDLGANAGDGTAVVSTDTAESTGTPDVGDASNHANNPQRSAATSPGLDLNFDGIGDALQPDVVTVTAFHGRSFVTIDAGGHALSDVESYTPTSRPSHGIALPYGTFGFTVNDVEPGGSATVDLILPEDARPDSYWKEDPQTGQLERFDFDGETGAIFDGNIVTLHLVDGGRGDADGVANGVIVDPGGPGQEGVVSVNCGSPDPLDGWTITESGGQGTEIGSVVAEDNQLVMREGNSFLVAMETTVTIPTSPSILTFDYFGTFDVTNPEFINDTFEVALLDGNEESVAPTFRFQRDSFFNFTEGESAALGALTTHFPDQTGATVSGAVDLDISGLPVGATYTLVFRLINNDHDLVRSIDDSQTIFRITCAHLPSAVDDAYSVNENNTLIIAAAGVLGNDTDPNNDPLTAVKVSDPANGTVTLNSDGSFTYTPNANFNGSDSFTYKANDGTSDSNVATVTITVNPVNDPPVAVNDAYSVNEDNTLTVAAGTGVLQNDSDPDGDAITAIKVTDPANGTVTLNSDGSFTYCTFWKLIQVMWLRP